MFVDRLNIKISVLSSFIYRFNKISIKILVSYFVVVTNRFLSLYEMSKTQNTQHKTEEQTILVTLALILKWVRVSPPLCSINLDM